jgi:hypothetical protein
MRSAVASLVATLLSSTTAAASKEKTLLPESLRDATAQLRSMGSNRARPP